MSNRTKYDPAAMERYGFPFAMSTLYTAAVTTTTNVNRLFVPTQFAKARDGIAFRITDILVCAQTVGDRTTLDKVKVVHIDSAGTVLATIADISIGNATKSVMTDVRNALTQLGYGLKPGEGIRLDGTVGSGGATSASAISVVLLGEAYGVVG